jgi:antitoxin component YwqK of YwqJK toxin-antitoxin module
MKIKVLSGISLLILIFSVGCKTKNAPQPLKSTFDHSMIDSIKSRADTFYSSRYPRRDISMAEYYVNRKDSTLTQVMKDSLGRIRQIASVRKKVRMFFAEYYPNGQVKADFHFDGYGQYDGPSKEYNEYGGVQRLGAYRSGMHVGKWKNYNDKGVLISVDEYNANGQQIR